MNTICRFSGRAVVATGLVVLWMVSPMSAESEDTNSADQLALTVGDAQQSNLKALKKYTWTTDTKLMKGGETKASAVNDMSFDADGKLQATEVSEESSVKKKRGLRGHVQKKKMGEFDQYLEGLLEQCFNYIFMSKGTLVNLFDVAKITEAKDAIQIDASNLFVKGDSIALNVDSTSHLPIGLTFKTTYEQDAVSGSVTFAQIENGPNHPTRFELQVPSKELEIMSETSDWAMQ